MGFRDSKCFLTSTAVVTRALFVIYDIVVIWSLYHSKESEPLWWLFIFSVVPLVGEMVIVIVFNGGREWNRCQRHAIFTDFISLVFLLSVFCPSFFIFILCVAPQLWLVEINRIERLNNNRTVDNNEVTLSATFSDKNYSFTFSYDMLVIGLKESLMYLLILARWVLPLQHLTYAQLSDTLLLYIGMAADLMELMDFSSNTEAMKDWNFVYALLGVWTLSLFQFTYVLVPTDDQDEKSPKISCSCNDVHSEVLGTLLNLFMMYIPFAAIRVVAMVLYKGVSYSSVFFMIKNMAMILLSFNRLIAMFCGRKRRKDKKQREEDQVIETMERPANEAGV